MSDAGEHARPATVVAELELRGGGGEQVDLWRTVRSHGLASLPPAEVDADAAAYRITLTVPGHGPRLVELRAARPGVAQVAVHGAGSRGEREAALAAVAHVLRLDQDLSPFYAQIAGDPELGWATQGAGRMMRGQTVFEDVVKTICTTNCSWSATTRMIETVVAHLGPPAPGASGTAARNRAFPSAAAMAAAGEGFYATEARAGYRSAYLWRISEEVAAGSLDLESLRDDDLSDDEVERRLLALPGVGPYAAAHVMLMGLGRTSRLILDSWTRPTYARLTGRRLRSDAVIERRFRRYRPYQGLAFWLFLTRGWVGSEPDAAPPV